MPKYRKIPNITLQQNAEYEVRRRNEKLENNLTGKAKRDADKIDKLGKNKPDLGRNREN